MPITVRRSQQHMVRNIVGLLVDIGAGSRQLAEIDGILEAKCRAASGKRPTISLLNLVHDSVVSGVSDAGCISTRAEC